MALRGSKGLLGKMAQTARPDPPGPKVRPVPLAPRGYQETMARTVPRGHRARPAPLGRRVPRAPRGILALTASMELPARRETRGWMVPMACKVQLVPRGPRG